MVGLHESEKKGMSIRRRSTVKFTYGELIFWLDAERGVHQRNSIFYGKPTLSFLFVLLLKLQDAVSLGPRCTDPGKIKFIIHVYGVTWPAGRHYFFLNNIWVEVNSCVMGKPAEKGWSIIKKLSRVF